jgi:transposase-like protein
MAISFKGAHFPSEVILMGVRWYVAYLLSTRHVEELMEERGVDVDHSTLKRWVIKYSPQLEEAFHRRKRPVWVSWRLDETYIKQVKYLNNVVEQDHRAVKRITRPMLGFKAFDAAQCTLAGVELMYMMKKRQLVVEAGDEGRTAAAVFYSLAA